jgi:PAS domain S-box-containing protein
VDGFECLSVFDDASDGVVAFDDDNRYVYANDAALRLYERSLVGETVGCFAVEPVGPRMTQFQAEGCGSGEVAIETGSGALRHLRYRCVSNCAPNLHLSIFRDAESTTPAPIEAAPSATLFHAVFERAADATLLTDDRRRYLAGNSAARRFLGVSRQTLLASRIDDFTPPSERDELDKMWEAFLSRGSMEGVFRILLPNGLQRAVLFQATANVTPARHLCTFRPAPRGGQTGQVAAATAPPEAQLTFREREILTLLARGATVAQMAGHMTLSPETVRTHVRNAMRRLGARSRPHAIALAMQQRQIDP